MANIIEIVITGKDLAAPVIRANRAEASGLGATWNKVGMVAGAALIGMGVEASKMASNFDAAMTRLTTQAGVSTGEMGTLKAGVLSLAGKVGEDPDSLAEALFHVESNFGSMGISSVKALGLLETAAKGAKVGGADLVDVTNALTASVAAGFPEAQNLDQAMGSLNATIGAGDMNMRDLSAAFGTGALPALKEFGLNLTDVGAALAVFGDNNKRGAEAMTTLRGAVQFLAAPSAGPAATAALDRLGLTSKTLADDMSHGGLLTAITDLHGRLQKSVPDTKEWGSVLTDVFGKKAGVGIGMLVDQFDRLKSKYPEITEGASNFGNAWEQTKNTTKQQFDQMKGAMDALMIEIGSKLLPVVMSLIHFFEDHTEILKILGIVVGVFLVGAFVAWGVSVIMATWPIILIIALIAALVVGIYELLKHWNTVLGALKTAWFDTWHAIYWFFVTIIWNNIWDFFKTIFNWIANNWPLLFSILGGPFGLAAYFIHQHWDSISGFFSRIVGDIKGFFVNTYHDIADPIVNAADWVIRKIREMATTVSGIVGGIKKTINSIPVVGSVAKFLGFAHGGVVGAAATGGPRGGLTRVAENGGELIDLPGGTRVYSASDTDRILSQGAGSGSSRVVLEIKSDGSRFSALLVEVLREAIRDRGGNVQKALGQN